LEIALTKESKCKALLAVLRSKADPKNLEGMRRFGISGKTVYGISIPEVRSLARKTGLDHELAIELWKSGVHEARILASMIDDPRLVTTGQMEDWIRDFDSWDLCDQCCGNLFDRTEFAYAKAREWSTRKTEFEKRAGFALMAELAVHDKITANREFRKFLTIIEKKGGDDDRNFVKKAVNWALRQIGKRNSQLNAEAIATALRMLEKKDLPAAKWIATDAIRELRSNSVRKKLKRKARRSSHSVSPTRPRPSATS
jgi:3-methyladenine DNA glycosylase AlkD